MTSMLLVQVCLGIAVLLLAGMAFLFWTNPAAGLRQTTHRPEQLPLVMADRYTAFAVMGVGAMLFGSLPVIAVFFLSCAIMGLADAAIYARAGFSWAKHVAAGGLSLVALAFTLLALMGQGRAV